VTTTLIPAADYERIFGVIYSVLEEHTHIAHSCVFFALIGSMILNQKYGIEARPRAGAAAYLVDAAGKNVSVMGAFENGLLVSTDEAFHCWIEAQGVIVDFMAPLFGDAMQSVDSTLTVPRRMFQKPSSLAGHSFDALKEDGDFLLQPNGALAEQLFQAFMNRPGSMDFLHVCLTWYVKPPQPLPDMSMVNDLGEVYPLVLKSPPLQGSW
jgi:hypothetical protein